MSLYEIYNSNTEKAQSIIEEYNITRGRVVYQPNEEYNMGLTILLHQVKEDLQEIENETFGTEILMAESIRFFMYILTLQHRPQQDWVIYYSELLKWFHSRNLLKWKAEITIKKAYKKKRVILTIADDHIQIPYQSTQGVINDFGRYRADSILAKRHEYGDIMTFEQVLSIIL